MAKGEVVDVVDSSDRVVGESTLERCLKEGLLHRAVAVLVIRKNGTLVLQQRSLHDAWHPGLWTISCTGHVKRGESYEGAARRELMEELGLGGRIVEAKKYLIPPISSRGNTEHEWVCLFTCRTDSECGPNPAEIEAIKEISSSELRRIIGWGLVTPDAVVILTDFLTPRTEQGGGS